MQIKLLHKPTYQKAGWNRRNNKDKFTIIVHSTNGRVNSTFKDEETFLLNSANVSSHFLISKDGHITQYFDDISTYTAWHAGTVKDEKYSNDNSIGIECHYTPGETTYLPKMIESLTWLVQDLMKKYEIVDIETHRFVAFPDGRKVDPSFMTDTEFYMWKSRLEKSEITPIVGHTNINIDILRNKLFQRGVLEYQIVPIVAAYTAYGELTQIGNVYPLAQWAHETGWGRSERWIKAYNPAGIGATNDGAWGSIFNNPSEGILAQYAHLLTYATKPEENTFVIEQIARLSPRHDVVTAKYGRGIAPNWQDLNGKWAVPGLTYSQRILEIAKYLQS